MNTVPTDYEPARDGLPTWHPSWCRQPHPGLTMHRSTTTLIRDRDGVRIDAYLVDYADHPMISLDITTDVDMSLIEFSTTEATRLHVCLTELLTTAGL